MKSHQPTKVWWYTQMDEDEKNTKHYVSWNPSKNFLFYREKL